MNAMTPNSEHGELVARLRRVYFEDNLDDGQANMSPVNPDGPEAADLIESLSLRMREMREALVEAERCIADAEAEFDCHWSGLAQVRAALNR